MKRSDSAGEEKKNVYDIKQKIGKHEMQLHKNDPFLFALNPQTK